MTGYVREMVEKDLDLKDFVWLCTRAFGLTISPSESLKPHLYHKDEIKKVEVKLAKLRKVRTKEARVAWAKRVMKKQIDLHRRIAAEEANLDGEKKIRAILVEFDAWKPPTEKHLPLQKYIREQLTNSLSSHAEYYVKKANEIEATDPFAYFIKEVEETKYNLVYHKRKWKEELAKTKENNVWLKKLRASLK